MSSEIDRILKGLTKAQRVQILRCESKAKHATTGEPCFYRAYADRETTANVLDRLGLSERSGHGHRIVALTPLGLAVRARLKETNDGR